MQYLHNSHDIFLSPSICFVFFAFMQIKSSVYIISSPSAEECPKADKPEYAFIGRSNVGKSSLINMICNNQKLAKISSSPGKTKLINHFLINNQWYLVDLPGYGYAKTAQKERKKWSRMIEDYLRKRETLVNIFALIDSRHEPQKNDLEFINSLGEWQVPFTIVFTKADKEKPKALERNVGLFAEALKGSWEFLPRQFISSAVEKTGRDEILDFIDACNKQVMKK